MTSSILYDRILRDLRVTLATLTLSPEEEREVLCAVTQHEPPAPSRSRRLTPQAEDVLRALYGREQSTRQLSRVCRTYRNRLSDLRALGYQVRSERRAGGAWFYSIVGPLPDGAPLDLRAPGGQMSLL